MPKETPPSIIAPMYEKGPDGKRDFTASNKRIREVEAEVAAARKEIAARAIARQTAAIDAIEITETNGEEEQKVPKPIPHHPIETAAWVDPIQLDKKPSLLQRITSLFTRK